LGDTLYSSEFAVVVGIIAAAVLELCPVSTRAWPINEQPMQPGRSRENDSVRMDGCAPIPLLVTLLAVVCGTPSESLNCAEQPMKYSNANYVVVKTQREVGA
jgi:hypothetical protein